MQMTEQQQASALEIQEGRSSSTRAVAGSGKTTTAVAGLRQVPRERKVLACAFNVAIKKTLEAKLQGHDNIECKTLNGLGHGLWNSVLKRSGKRAQLSEYKIRDIIETLFPSRSYDERAGIANTVRQARLHGTVTGPGCERYTALAGDDDRQWAEYAFNSDVPDDKTETTIDAAKQVLAQSILSAFAGQIDFDDQIYMPVITGQAIRFYDQIVGDEIQDLNPLQHAMLGNAIGAQLNIIGDPHQSIYGFRGAVDGSMQQMEKKFNLPMLPLTFCFRCGTDIVRFAQQYCPTIQPWSSNPTGTINQLGSQWTPKSLERNSTVLCRYNAPLLKLTFQLLGIGRRPDFRGRDIGKSITSSIKQALGRTAPSAVQIDRFLGMLRTWSQSEVAKLEAKKQESKVQTILDRVDSIHAVIDYKQDMRTAKDLLDFVRVFFSEENPGEITLMSIHRSKGLEFPHVYWLDSFNVPSRYALKQAAQGNDGPLLQERNLQYVATTRAMSTLSFIDMPTKDRDADKAPDNTPAQ